MHPSVRLLIARHAESGMNGENRIQGHLDSKLTPRGRRQAERLARRLEGFRLKRIYSSDLGRAWSTTRFIARRLGERVTPEPRLREIRLGQWEGLTPDEVNARFRGGYDRWRRAPSRMRIPGAETMGEFRRRVVAAVADIVRRERSGAVLLVTHGGVIASLLAEWLDADFDRVLLNIKIDNTSITFAEVVGRRVLLHAVNDVSHLVKRDRSDEFTVFTKT